MNINITSNYDTAEAMNIRLLADRSKNREVDNAIANNESIANETISREKEKIQEKIQQAVTMDVSEVKDFLFMLIGAEVKVKPENDNSGALINRLV
jgi:RNA polymerase-interacting CarD/CdnL/TRCF family regulator